jgi:zinc-finger binding domain of transposase IS66
VKQAEPPAEVFRLRRRPDPWAWPDWAYADADGTFGNRYDDAQGIYRVLYASTQRVATFVECLAYYRPDIAVMAELDQIAGEDQARQVFEVPPVVPVVTEHRSHSYLCACGCRTTAPFPEGVRGPVSYGPRVRAILCYLLGRQHVPVRRVTETMEDLFGLKICRHYLNTCKQLEFSRSSSKKGTRP